MIKSALTLLLSTLLSANCFGASIDLGANLVAGGLAGPQLRLVNPANNSFASINASPSMTLTTLYYWPTADGASGTCLKTNGLGTLSFQSCAGGGGGANTALSNLASVAINAEMAAQTGSALSLTSDTQVNINGFGGNEVPNVTVLANSFGVYANTQGATHQFRGSYLDFLPSLDQVEVMTTSWRDLDGDFFAGIKSPDVLAASYTLTLPPDDGDSGDCLKTNGTGVLSFDSCGGGFDPSDIDTDLVFDIGVGGSFLANIRSVNRASQTDTIQIKAGDVTSGADSPGGVNIIGGNGDSNTGGGINLIPGTSTSGDGGSISGYAGDSPGATPGSILWSSPDGFTFMKVEGNSRLLMQEGDGSYIDFDSSLDIRANTVLLLRGNGQGVRIGSHVYTSNEGAAPVVSACGTTPAISGDDNSGKVTIGSGGLATSCTITFDTAWVSAPHCFVNNRTTIAVNQATTTTTTLTINSALAFAVGAEIDYHCIASQ